MPLLTTRAGASAGAYGFGAGAIETTSYVLLASTTVTSGTSLTLSSIPSGYMGYAVFLRGTSNGGAGSTSVNIEPRTSGGASSTQVLTKGMHGQSWSWNWEGASPLTINSQATTSYARNYIEEVYYNFGASDYTSGVFRELRWGNTTDYHKFGGGSVQRLSGTAALNSIAISLYEYPSTPPFSFCQVYLYGIKSA